jgi:uncharacterized membrane protein YukC
MTTQKMRFMDAFIEDKNETLTLQVKMEINGQTFESGTSFRKNEKLGGVDFHILRYLDLAVEPIDDSSFRLTGFFPQQK